MIAGLFLAISAVFSILTLKLIYGKKYNNENKNKNVWKVLLLSVGFLIWFLCIGFLVLGLAAKDKTLCLLISIGFPAIIAIWAIIVRFGTDNNTLSESPKEEATDIAESNTETYSMHDEDTGTWICNVRGGYDIQSLSEQEQNESCESHKWRCDKCGEMISSSPCEFCSKDENATSETTEAKQSTYTWKCHRCFNEISSYPCKYCSENQESNQIQPEYDLYDKIVNWFKTVFGK